MIFSSAGEVKGRRGPPRYPFARRAVAGRMEVSLPLRSPGASAERSTVHRRQILVPVRTPWAATLLVAGLIPLQAEAATLADRVDAAIERGRSWLLEELGRGRFPHGEFPMGIRSLYLYALLKAGADPDDPVITATLKRVEGMRPQLTYSVALHLMALVTWARVRAKVKLLEPGQDRASFSFLGEKRKRAEELVGWLIGARVKDRAQWTYERAAGTRHDNSNSQFAILGIEIGLRNGLDVPAELLEVIGETFTTSMTPIRSRAPERVTISFQRYAGRRASVGQGRTRTIETIPNGWGYQADSSGPTFSMTCAGLSNLAVARWGLEKRGRWSRSLEEEYEEALFPSMAWIALHWDELAKLRPGPKQAERRYYYTVYSLEKAGDLAEVSAFGRHEWYTEEAEFLLRDQQDDGQWGRHEWPGVATSFALLFLARATARFHALNDIVVTGKGSDEDLDLVYVEDLGGRVPMGSLLCAALTSDEPAVLRMAEEGIGRFPSAVRGRLVPSLLLLAREGPSGTQGFARRALHTVTGETSQSLDTCEGWCGQWNEIRRIEGAGDPNQAGRLVEIARSGPWESLRLEAIAGVERMNALDVLGDVIALLDDTSPAVRGRALACVRFLTGMDVTVTDLGNGKAARNEVETWLYQGPGRGIVRTRKVAAALRAYLAVEPPGYSAEALEVLKAHPEESTATILSRMNVSRHSGGLVDYRLFLALRAITGEDYGLDPELWRRGLRKARPGE